MTKVLAFIFVLALAQSFPFEAISGDSSTTANAIAEGRNVSEEQLKSPGTGGDASELGSAKSAYFGKPGSVCKTKYVTNCYKSGACCKGDGACKLLYDKIMKMSSLISGWTLVNFCSLN